ncbi:hypothetical protein P3T36_005772 [Kitasatospora sp. MAP12-15]|uniref:DUF5304 family protein n=1 Tax=unclassified Kitasatospora TaxID=2633591 RepID=UPI002473A292|nr:DUF5304 family protein [Kitasatospora sp. MAP12-44]MDH6110046.1 hypothetical protein [Kitasatospora sp. MAP12-44]
MNSSDPVDNPLGPLVDETRKLAFAVGGKALHAAGRFRDQYPEVYEHLATAGTELMAAYRAAVAGHERRWAAPEPSGSERIDVEE